MALTIDQAYAEWMDEDADRINAMAELAKEYAATLPKREENRAFCPTGNGGGVDNSCGPSSSNAGAAKDSGGPGKSSAKTKRVDRSDISKLVQKIAENPDGFTLDPLSSEQPTDGIMVSEYVNDSRRSVKIKADEITSRDGALKFSRWYADNADLLVGDQSKFVGGWKAGDDFYIDVATRFDPSQSAEALEAGRKAGQLAVFNLATFKETWVQYESGDKRKPKEWDAAFARARKDSSVKQVYDDSTPAMSDEDWADELSKHGKTTVRHYNEAERSGNGKDRAIRHPHEADDHRGLQGFQELRGEGGVLEGRETGPGVVRRQPGADASPVQGSASPPQEVGWLKASKVSRSVVAEASRIVGVLPNVEFRSVGNSIATYSQESDTIYVSPSIGFSDAAELKDSCDSGWLSQPNPVLHEYAHRYHFMCDPEGHESSCRRSLTLEQKSIISGEVSRYATTSSSEFIAEYVAGRLSGKTYSNEIREIVLSITDGAVRL